MNYVDLIDKCFENRVWDSSLQTPQYVAILEDVTLKQDVTLKRVILSNNNEAIYTNKIFKVGKSFLRVVYGRFLGQFYIEISDSTTNPLLDELAFSEDTRHGERLNIPYHEFENFSKLSVTDLLFYFEKMDILGLNGLLDFMPIKTLYKLFNQNDALKRKIESLETKLDSAKDSLAKANLLIEKIKKITKSWKKYSLILDLFK